MEAEQRYFENSISPEYQSQNQHFEVSNREPVAGIWPDRVIDTKITAVLEDGRTKFFCDIIEGKVEAWMADSGVLTGETLEQYDKCVGSLTRKNYDLEIHQKIS